MKYICDICNYETSNFPNFYKHKKTQKHIEKNQIEKNKCPNCGKIFIYKQGLYKHKKLCKNEIIQLKNENEKLKSQLFKKETELVVEKERSKNLETYKQIAITANEATKTSAEASKCSMSALSFLTKYFTDTAPITKFEKVELLQGKSKLPIVELAIIYYKSTNYTLHTYIGDILVREYKKKDSSEQSIWNSDTSRNNYILREKLESDNSSIWSPDKEGHRMAILMIDPMLNYLFAEIQKYIKKYALMLGINNELTDGQRKEITDNLSYATGIQSEIESGVLKEKIISYMASYFYLDKNIIANVLKTVPNQIELEQ